MRQKLLLMVFIALAGTILISGCLIPQKPVCGNSVCEKGENSTNCEKDCKKETTCGNSFCESGETETNCPQDCKSITAVCGNGSCETGENPTNCPQDCKTQSIVTITVNASKAGGSFNQEIVGGVNVAVGMHENLPTFLDQVGSNLFRFKMYTWLVNEELDNYFLFEGVDYSAELKRQVDEVHGRGGKVMMELYGVPRWLSACDFATNEDCDKVIKNNVPDYSKYPPSDYGEWRRLIKTMIEEFQGLGVQIDYFEIYGEPDWGSTWWGDGSEEAIPSYLEHYRQTAQAIRSADPNAKVGGAAFVAGWKPLDLNLDSRRIRWIKAFVGYIKQNDLPLDFFSWHAYSPRTEILRLDAKTFKEYLAGEGFDIPLFLTEWGVEGGANLRDKASTHFGASFATAALIEISQSENDGQNYYTLADKTAKKGLKFGMITYDDKPKPAFNAFRLFSMLKGERIEAISDEKPYTVNGGTGIESKDIRVLATRNAANISLIATYYVPVPPEEDPRYDLSKEIKIVINDVPFPEYAYKMYLIDGTHSNYLGGNPELEIVEEGQGNGSFQKQLTLPIYGVALIKIEEAAEAG